MNNERPRGTWAWPPLVPRPILAVAWAGFNGITALAIAIDLIQAPAGMPVGGHRMGSHRRRCQRRLLLGVAGQLPLLGGDYHDSHQVGQPGPGGTGPG